MSEDAAERIRRRLDRMACALPADRIARLVTYVDLLTRWNRRINLTALSLEPLTDEAVDRLIVEPVIAARLVRSTERVVLDVGSGGGSPAIPFHIAAGTRQLVMVEVRERKSAFLREAGRAISDGTAVVVETATLTNLVIQQKQYVASVDIVTVRAVALDDRLLAGIRSACREGARLFWFRTMIERTGGLPGSGSGWPRDAEQPLCDGNGVVSVYRVTSRGAGRTGKGSTDNLTFRPANPEDAKAIADLHFAAVHTAAAPFYPVEILDSWSGQLDDARYEDVRRAIAQGNELFVVAEDEASGVVAFGSIVPSLRELRAVYVHPSVGRQGVGAAILRRLEAMAVAERLPDLHLSASLNAAAFYRRAGYESVEESFHKLRSGHQMACVKMLKRLNPSG